MFIRSNLFSRGHPLDAEVGLSKVLEGHKQGILNKIRGISDLEQMTDAFLERLVKESLVETLAIHFDNMTRKLRTETLDASYMPEGSMGARIFRSSGNFELQGGNQKQVARLTIPFSGDASLLKFSPKTCGLTFPQGEVSGQTIQFDVILWGTPEDAQRIKDEIKMNIDQIADYAGRINQQVKEFNESLPEQVKSAFTVKLEELTKQHAAFDDLGIPDEAEPPELQPSSGSTPPKKGKGRGKHIIQFVENLYVHQLNQTNNNIGDVNNAIQAE